MARKRAHSLAWFVAGLLILSGLSAWMLTELRNPPFPAAPQGNAEWFLMLRMPEISAQYESGVDTMKVRMDQWLDHLVQAGFVPMRFSEVVRRLARHQGLPDRALVIFFNPGYRKTYDIIAPIFLKHQSPVVWLTKQAALRAADRRYLTYHALRQMHAFRGWDTGYVDADPSGSFSVNHIAEFSTARWAPEAGAFALNRWSPSKPFHFLTVNADWMAEELVDRLWVEAPATGPVVLGKAVIHSREWGTAQPETPAGQAVKTTFDLQAPLNKRGTKLYWFSTLGQNDFRLKLDAKSLYGELWLQLRFDENTGSDVHLIMNGNGLFVEEKSGQELKRLAGFAPSRPFVGRAFSLEVEIAGDRLSVSMDGETPKSIDHLTPPVKNRGLVQLYISDRLHGTAKAQALHILYTPLFSKTEEPKA